MKRYIYRCIAAEGVYVCDGLFESFAAFLEHIAKRHKWLDRAAAREFGKRQIA